jgi:biotin operon repressor
MTDTIPANVRPTIFAINELMMELLYLLQAYSNADMESVLIMLYVTDATMRPFMHDQAPSPEVLTTARPADAIRGAISRRMIAEKTGLSRETVRRKTQALAKAGFVLIDADDRVRSAQHLGDEKVQRMVLAGHKAVVRYVQRLESYGVDWRAT